MYNFAKDSYVYNEIYHFPREINATSPGVAYLILFYKIITKFRGGW